jgi:UDP-N-acetylmuramyl tripeptide synthase
MSNVFNLLWSNRHGANGNTGRFQFILRLLNEAAHVALVCITETFIKGP